MEKLQDLSQSELQELLDNPERVEAMALESDEVQTILYFPFGCHFPMSPSERLDSQINVKNGGSTFRCTEPLSVVKIHYTIHIWCVVPDPLTDLKSNQFYWSVGIT